MMQELDGEVSNMDCFGLDVCGVSFFHSLSWLVFSRTQIENQSRNPIKKAVKDNN